MQDIWHNRHCLRVSVGSLWFAPSILSVRISMSSLDDDDMVRGGACDLALSFPQPSKVCAARGLWEAGSFGRMLEMTSETEFATLLLAMSEESVLCVYASGTTPLSTA